jgi:Uncharacterised nucleotidyltransferase
VTSQATALPARRLLTHFAARPEALTSLSLDQWDLILRQARRAGILARFAFQLDELGLIEDVPEAPRQHLIAARILALKHIRDVRWEVACVRQVLKASGVPLTLLKGAAYVMAELPAARGRLFGDIDFMVPRERIEEVENILLEADWVAADKDEYDQQYYRRWTHQIPPLAHYKRNTVLDVHHTIVQVTARTAVAADTLETANRPLSEDGLLRVLAPADMVLHSAVHLFNEGEFKRGLRDLLDLSDLLKYFGGQAGFWERLIERAETLGLTQPLYFTLRYQERLFDATFPDPIRQAARRWQPPAAKRAIFDALFLRALLPDHHSCDGPLTGFARWLLFARAHYLRMPLHLLIPHLLRKSFHRPPEDKEEDSRKRLQERIEQLLRLTPPPKIDAADAKVHEASD